MVGKRILEPRALEQKERRHFLKRFRRDRNFKEAARRILETPLGPGWKEAVQAQAERGEINFYDWIVWSLIYTAAGDSDITGEKMSDRPPDPRAVRALAELAQELKPEQEAGTAGAKVFVHIGPVLPLPEPPKPRSLPPGDE